MRELIDALVFLVIICYASMAGYLGYLWVKNKYFNK